LKNIFAIFIILKLKNISNKMATVIDDNVELIKVKTSIDSDIQKSIVPEGGEKNDKKEEKKEKKDDKGGKGDKKEKPMNTAHHHIPYHKELGNKDTVRLMPNGHWAIPFSCAFVMKKIKEF